MSEKKNASKQSTDQEFVSIRNMDPVEGSEEKVEEALEHETEQKNKSDEAA